MFIVHGLLGQQTFVTGNPDHLLGIIRPVHEQWIGQESIYNTGKY